MSILDRTGPYCIIGAGSSGLAAAKNLNQHGVPFGALQNARNFA